MVEKVYICRAPAFTEERNGRYLMIWDNIPNWMVVDEEAFEFLNTIQGETTTQEIVEQFQEITQVPEEIINGYIETLIDAKILYEKGDSSQFLTDPDKLMSIVVYPTNRCNLRCIMCYNKENLLSQNNQNELTIEEFKDFLDQAAPLLAEKGTNLQILGGEPLTVPEKTLAIIEYASPMVEHISLSTNGTLVTKEFAQNVSAVENVSVQVSLDSPNRRTHERIRGKGTFNRTIKGVKLLVEEDVMTVLNMVCHRANLDELEHYYKFALELGVSRARFIPLQQAGAGITCGLEPPSYLEMMEKGFTVFQENPDCRKLMGSDFLSIAARLCHICAIQSWCGTGSRLVMLNADGEVYPCPNHHLPEFQAGNIREKPFKEIWENAEPLQRIRQNYPVTSLNEKCAACPVRYWCAGWCRGETYQMTGSMRAPSIKCEEIHQMFIDMFFRLSEDKEVFGQLKKVFGKSLSLEKL